MSADAEAPSLNLNVRYSREDKKNKGQQEDIQVESYEDQETLKLGHADLRSHKVAHRRRFATAIILVLYLLILAGVFMRYISVTLDQKTLVMEKEQLMITLNQTQARITNLTQENDELQTRYDSLSNENSRLKTENMNMKAGGLVPL
ncbi:uncharacterized protein LOC113747302 isoform X2 [Larimichthys crocea]|uniref:uncharacterized protein LOC113747302 isoform X2 n=1 Tax=Larimichthys crocea TaxID=215358 RepID=UPI000F5E7816|nr:uncharacterized protein LOC113747302 isoform X2 [Larimichthys crocea]